MLTELVHRLRQAGGLTQKRDIQTVSQVLGPGAVRLGDDCAAIPDGDGYLLLAAEGLWPQLVQSDPWFAGWCAVMVNVSDIYAMGGRPLAVVDTIWSQSVASSLPLWEGMQAAARAYHVPIVGGHTNSHSPYDALSVAILGRAGSLISSFAARPGDQLLVAFDLRGALHARYPFWNAATEADPARLRSDLAILPQLAESGLCDAGKDISMGGLVGTLLMLLETSDQGATLDLEAIPLPPEMTLEHWLVCFPSYGFLLSVRPELAGAVQQQFSERDLSCAAIGTVESGKQLVFRHRGECVLFWDLAEQALTGFSPSRAAL